MALSAAFLRPWPVSTSLLYLCIGVVLGPFGFDLIYLDAVVHSELLERVAEVAVIVSLFTTGLKLRLPFGDRRWFVALRLAFGSMALTVGLITIVGVWGLGLPIGAAVLLGAVLAPTDPVLASEVQVDEPNDNDRVRFGLTAEAGFNDGTAFPFVMLGLGLLGVHEIGDWGWRWWTVDLLWAVPAGLGIGWGLGCLVGKLVVYLRVHHRESVGLDDFLALGLIALSYGVALALHSYGFLAVFAAGLALRRIEHTATKNSSPDNEHHVENNKNGAKSAGQTSVEEDADLAPAKVPEEMAHQVLVFNEQVERILELAVVLLLGGLLTTKYLPPEALWFVPLLFFVVRPLVVWTGLVRTRTTRKQRGMMMWFGIRGIGSIYYLMYAVNHGLSTQLAEQLTALTLATVAASIVLHGVTSTPLMKRYKQA